MAKAILRTLHYDNMQIASKAAYAEYNSTARSLDMAHIRERGAELGSQSFISVAKGALHKSLGEISEREREVGLSFVRYAVYGRTDEA